MAAVQALIEPAKFVIAHNAKFDRALTLAQVQERVDVVGLIF